MINNKSIIWKEINWAKTKNTVLKVQFRIYNLACNSKTTKVKWLQNKLVNSQAAKLLAVREVTTLKKVKITDDKKADLVKSLTLHGKSQPITRKKKGEKREKKPQDQPEIAKRAKRVLDLLASAPIKKASTKKNEAYFKNKVCFEPPRTIVMQNIEAAAFKSLSPNQRIQDIKVEDFKSLSPKRKDNKKEAAGLKSLAQDDLDRKIEAEDLKKKKEASGNKKEATDLDNKKETADNKKETADNKKETADLDKKIEAAVLKSLPQYHLGQILTVDVLIQEGNKKRIQSYTGVLINQHRAGLKSTITVRKLSKGIGVERVFPIHSPDIQNIHLVHAKKEL